MRTLYQPGRSWLHRLDPVSTGVLAGTVIALVLLQPGLSRMAGVLAAGLALLASAGLLAATARAFAGVVLVAVSFLLVQGLVYPGNATPVLTLGPLVLHREGLLVGLLLGVRLYAILAGSLLLLLSTRPSDLVESLVRRGLSPRLGYVLSSVLQVIPLVSQQLVIVRDAQRARGLDDERSPWARVAALVPLLGPVVTSALMAGEERALALEVRGFSAGGARTYLNEEHRPTYAGAVRAACGVALLAGVVARFAR
jgi:energy-coupling factor transport system permease protein